MLTISRYFIYLMTLSVTSLAFSASINETLSTPFSNTLSIGQSLQHGESLISKNGKYRFTLQSDGNAVLYTKDEDVVWLINTYGTGASALTLKHNGNLAIDNSEGRTIWSTKITENQAVNLTLHNNGNLALYNAQQQLLWSRHTDNQQRQIRSLLHIGERLNIGDSLTSDNQIYRLDVQADGNVAIYNTREDRAVWVSNTYGLNTTHLILQYDGNLVIYDTASRGLWTSGTYGKKSSAVKLMNDGKLVIQNDTGKPMWISNSKK